MTEIMNVIFQRRSIRKYQEREVEREHLIQLIKAATAAPTACNNQPWEFIVVTDPKVLADLREHLMHARYKAPAAIVVCGNLKLAKGGMRRYWEQDCSAAMENILLAATGLELGSLWVGVHPLPSVIKPVAQVLNIPDYVVPLGIAYIGYPAQAKEPRTQYDESRMYWEQYDPDRKHRARPKNLKYK